VSLKVLVHKTVTGPMRYGATIAFVAAAPPLPMAFWALVAGVVAAGVPDAEAGQAANSLIILIIIHL
jgi:hypothetical protein